MQEALGIECFGSVGLSFPICRVGRWRCQGLVFYPVGSLFPVVTPPHTHTLEGRFQASLFHHKSFPSALGHWWFQKWQRWHLMPWKGSSWTQSFQLEQLSLF